MFFAHKSVLLVFVTTVFWFTFTLASTGVGTSHPDNRQRSVLSTDTGTPQAASEVQALIIALHPYGFDPPEIEVEEGRFLLVVQNRSGLKDLTFRLDAEKGGRMHEDQSRRSKWSKRFDLKEGVYRLSVVDDPAVCVIRVHSR